MLVKDIIIGVFIQFENGMNIGDLVIIGLLIGIVEWMLICFVGVCQDIGVYYIILWFLIIIFVNFVCGIGLVVVNYDVDCYEDVDKVNQVLKDVVVELMENEEICGLIIGELNFVGIVGLSNIVFILCVLFIMLLFKQWMVCFVFDSQVKKYFDLVGVCVLVQIYQVLFVLGVILVELLLLGELMF